MAVAQPQLYCLRWNNHQHNLLSVFEDLLNHEAFVDVTLSCDGLNLKAHKMVLSACSPYFQSMFYNTPDKHPVVFLKDVRYEEMKALLEFMYRGEVSVDQQNLSSLLKVAESLKIKGLADVKEPQAANLPPISHNPYHHLPPLPLTSSMSGPGAHPPTLIPSYMTAGSGSPLLSPGMSSSKRPQTDSLPVGSAFLGSKRKRGRPRRLSGSDIMPAAINLCEERMEEGNASSPIHDVDDITEHAQSPVKSLKEGNVDSVSLSPTDLKTSDIPSEAESNDGRSSGLLINSRINVNGKDKLDQVLDLQTRLNSVSSEKSSPSPTGIQDCTDLHEQDNAHSSHSPLPLTTKPLLQQHQHHLHDNPQLPPPLTPPNPMGPQQGKPGKSPGKRTGSPGKPGRPPGSGRSPGRSPSGTRGNLASQPGTESESLQDMSVRGLDLLKYAQMSSDGSFRCLECEKMQLDKSFKNKYSFQRHAFLYHEGQQRKVFPCPVCQKEFSRPDKMKQHLKQVHDCIIPKTDSAAATASLASPPHFMIPSFLTGLEDPTAGVVDAKLQADSSGSEMFKLMSRLVGHGQHTSSGSGSGKAS